VKKESRPLRRPQSSISRSATAPPRNGSSALDRSRSSEHGRHSSDDGSSDDDSRRSDDGSSDGDDSQPYHAAAGTVLLAAIAPITPNVEAIFPKVRMIR